MKNTAEMTLGSLFDGIAGFPLAARRQGIKTVWVSEIEPDCIDIAKRHFPEALQLCGFIDTHRRRSNFIPGTGRVSHYLFNGCK